MTAAADYAEGASEQPPYELATAWRCKLWRCLPRPGGLFDQPLGLMKRVESALNVYDALAARARAKNSTEFFANYPDLVKLCLEIDKLRNSD